MLTACSPFGANPEGSDLLRIQHSRQYDAAEKVFVNSDPTAFSKMKEKSFSPSLIPIDEK